MQFPHPACGIRIVDELEDQGPEPTAIPGEARRRGGLSAITS